MYLLTWTIIADFATGDLRSLAMSSPKADATSDWFEIWSVLVAGVAAALALGSLLTQLREIYWARPVIVLDSKLRASPRGWDTEILVTNVGERAVTITRSGWWYSFGTHFEDIHEANTSVRLPHRLEPHDAVSLRGRIKLKDAHWEWSNGGLFKRSPHVYDPPSGAWRSDDFPTHDQYADPFVEIVRRPRSPVVRAISGLSKLSARSFLRSAWHRSLRNGAPKGHSRVWGEAQIIRDPNGGGI